MFCIELDECNENINPLTLYNKIFDKDYIIKMYADKNSKVCRELGLVPTNTITLALGNHEQHAKFIRGNYVRVCITDELMS